MKSPFPGMDPYLETRWGDVHQRLIIYSADQLAEQLPSDLRARVEERVFVETEAGLVRRIVADVQVTQYPSGDAGGSTLAEDGGAMVAEPTAFLLQEETVTESSVEIREQAGGRVITVIEFLSPGNKEGGEGQRQYLQKQRDILQSGTNLVEIDLVRSGQRVIAFPARCIPPIHRLDYLACVRCGWSRKGRELYAMPLRQPLPAIAIPLRQADRPARLDLQALIAQCYRNSRHDDIDYSGTLAPPLPAGDATWAEALLKAAGKR